MKMSYEDYRDAVVNMVVEYRISKGLSGVCCTDTILDFYRNGCSLDEAFDDAELYTAYWEGDLM